MAGNDQDLNAYKIVKPAPEAFDKLRLIPFFNIFREDEQLAAVIGNSTWLRVPEGTHVIKEGDQCYDFFVLVKGSARVVKGGSELATIERGEVFGEMGALLHQPRTADIVAHEECVLFRMFVSNLNKLPIDVVLLIITRFYRATATRLQAADKKLAEREV